MVIFSTYLTSTSFLHDIVHCIILSPFLPPSLSLSFLFTQPQGTLHRVRSKQILNNHQMVLLQSTKPQSLQVVSTPNPQSHRLPQRPVGHMITTITMATCTVHIAISWRSVQKSTSLQVQEIAMKKAGNLMVVLLPLHPPFLQNVALVRWLLSHQQPQ